MLNCHENATNKTKTGFLDLNFSVKCDKACPYEFHFNNCATAKVEGSSQTSDSPERKQAAQLRNHKLSLRGAYQIRQSLN